MKKSPQMKKFLAFSISLLMVLSYILIPLNSANATTNEVTLKEAPLNQNFVNDQIKNSVSISGMQTSSRYPLGNVQAPFKLPSAKPSAFTKETFFPSAYDLRTTGKLTPIRDQLTSDSCWAFASIASIESNLLPTENRDFSENNLKNTHGFDVGANDGGNLAMATAYTARWSGPINESDDPYDPNSTNSQTGLIVQKHIQDVLWIPDRTASIDNDGIKNAVMKYGAVDTTMFWKDGIYSDINKTYYDSYPDKDNYGNNHAVDIVGWDDDFDKNKFYDSIDAKTPPANGAFIVRNTWGTSWGQAGYFYISYYDANIGANNGVFDVIEPTANYSTNYQYDPLGYVDSIGYSSDTAWYANVFTASSSQNLSAVSFYTTVPNTNYEVYACSNYNNPSDLASARVLKASGTISIPGYHTIKLNAGTSVVTGNKFAVIVKAITPNYTYPIPIEEQEDGYSSGATAAAGQSYASDTGSSWDDLTSYNATANVCLKAFTTVVTPRVSVERISGLNRIETSIAIAKEQYTNQAPDSVVLATANDFPDALAGSGLSYKYNAPLLLVNKTVSKSKDVLNYITTSLAKNKNIYILGGTGAVSKEISDYLTTQGYKIIRLGGNDRYETNQKIVDYLNIIKGTSIVISTGDNFADALSISSIADIKGYPILLNGKDSLSTSVSKDITNIQPTTIYVIGGTGVLSANIENQIKKLNKVIKIVRIGGEDRYDTSMMIVDYFNLATNTISVATGLNFPDALSGSVLAARKNSGVLLVDNKDVTKQRALINKAKITNLIVFGGEGVISNAILNSLIQQ